jgi:glycosyltransferase involved in cell wall biosynthesis
VTAISAGGRQTVQQAITAADVSVIVPTRNEQGNVLELLRRLDDALGAELHVIIADDSDDDTPHLVREHAAASGNVTLVHRDPEQRLGGLGGAVAAGLAVNTRPWILVMDGDLQHPPSAIPDMLAAAQRTGADLVVASRYVGDGDASGLDGAFRMSASAVCNNLARTVFRRKLRAVTDPMSGFFALRVAAVSPGSLQPNGYKILLEIIARADLDAITEVPYAFQPRFAGESKATVREGLRFFRQLVRLRRAAKTERV